MAKPRRKIRNRALSAVAVGTLIALALAGIAVSAGRNDPVTVTSGNLKLTFNGGFSPETLSKSRQTPIGLSVEARIRATDGTHPPALREFRLETDRNGEIDVKGYPTCRSGLLQSRDTDAAMEGCRPALVGSGTATAEVALAEQRPIDVRSKLLVFNGGVRGATTTLYVHAYFSAPIRGAVVTPVKIERINNGRYGLRSTASIPKIAGGNGSLTHFRVTVDKKFTYRGKRVSVLTAKCPDGKFQVHSTAIFSDRTKASAEILRTCTGTN